MTLPNRIHHGAALAHARRILSNPYSPGSQLVRIARAYVDLHEKSVGVLRGTLEQVDALMIEGRREDTGKGEAEG